MYLVQEKHTGILNGEAYLVMPVDDEAEQAIAQLNGTDYKGQSLRVSQAEAADFPTGEFW